MSPSRESLIAAALRPLPPDGPARVAAERILEQVVPVEPPGAERAMARWEEIDDTTSRKSRWPLVLALALAVLSVWQLALTTSDALSYRALLPADLEDPFLWLPEDIIPVLTRGLGPRERFLLLGDETKATRPERMKSLWDSAPDNPAYCAAYASAYRSLHGAHPPDFLTTARRIDPDNGWFTYLAAGDAAHDAIKKKPLSSSDRKAGLAPAWEIKNPERLEQAMSLLREANDQPRFEDRAKDFAAGQVPLLPQTDFPGRIASMYYLILGNHYGGNFSLRYLAEGIAARAWLLGETGDKEGLVALADDAEKFAHAFANPDSPHLLEALMFKAWVTTPVANLHAAAEKLGLAKEAARYGGLKERLARLKEDLARSQADGGELELKMRAGEISGRSCANLSGSALSPPRLAEEDLVPGRMAERMLVSRALALLVWLVFGLGLLALGIHRWLLGRGRLGLARRINALLLPADRVWILGAGMLAPWALVSFAAHGTPLGGRDWSLLTGGGWLPLAACFLTITALGLALPGVIAAWRIGRRAASLGLDGGVVADGWLAAIAALALVPALGMTQPPGANVTWFLAVKALLLLPLAGIMLGAVVRALCGRPERRLMGASVSAALAPVYAAGMMLALVSMAAYRSVQADFELRDPLTEILPNGVTRFESAVARQVMLETRARLP